MSIYIKRVVLVAAGALIGWLLGMEGESSAAAGPIYALIGALVLIVGIAAEHWLRRSSPLAIIGGTLGVLLGLFVAWFTAHIIENMFPGKPHIHSMATGVLSFGLGYLGIMLGARKFREFWTSSLTMLSRDGTAAEVGKILDTSVIIDGRVADIAHSGFLEGPLLIPQFVLRELQFIADSADSMKRTRGRRGLDVLREIQKQNEVEVRIVDQDFPKIRGVDAKLVAYGKMINGKILTNDYNLNKVAEVQGVKVLNINELSNALKPVVLPGEHLKVKVIKEGTEIGQGVAYLDDGTMVVVESGKKHLGKTVDAVVTSVLQTTAGRMIFTKIHDEAHPTSSEA